MIFIRMIFRLHVKFRQQTERSAVDKNLNAFGKNVIVIGKIRFGFELWAVLWMVLSRIRAGKVTFT